MEIKKVILDMDGVLTNFYKGVCDAFGKSSELKGKISYDFWNSWDDKTTRDQINAICNKDFWRNLEWHDEGKEILEILESAYGAENIELVTRPMDHAGSWNGKKLWIMDNMIDYRDRLTVTTRSRSVYAASDVLLIDDWESNVNAFREAGGQAILIPRPWNLLARHKVIQHLKNELRSIQEKERETKMLDDDFISTSPRKNYHGHPQFYKLLVQMAELHSRKNHDYAGIGNPLRNFYKCKEMGLTPFQGIMVRLSDKWSRLESFLKQGTLEVKDESVKDTLMDNAVYSLLATILLDEQLKDKKECPENASPE